MAWSRGRVSIILYVAVVTAVAAALLATDRPEALRLRPERVLFLFLACLASELLWLPTISGRGTASSASLANVAVIVLVPPDQAMWIVGTSAFIGTLFFQQKEWFKGIFAFSQMAVTTFLAGHAFLVAAGDVVHAGSFEHPRALLGVLVAVVVYFFANTFFVAGAIALTEGARVRSVWRREYGYGHDISSSAALFALAPLLVLSYLSVGVAGIALFFVPILFIRDADKKYRDLLKAQDALISTERFAAKGEMAASIAHELNNYLAVLSGRAQLMMMSPQKAAEPKNLQIIRDQIGNMKVLTDGLLGFSQRESKKAPCDLNDVIQRAVEMVRPQNKYDGIEWELDLDPSVGVVLVDGGQMTQILMNFFSNAADAFRDAKSEARRVRIESRRQGAGLEFAVADNGPGMPPAVQKQVFEPSFTTKVDGHGFGLATCYMIAKNHQGKIAVKSAVGEGTTFTVSLPADEMGGAPRTATAA